MKNKVLLSIKRKGLALWLWVKRKWSTIVVIFVIGLNIFDRRDSIREYILADYRLTIEPKSILWNAHNVVLEYSLANPGNEPVQILSQNIFKTFNDPRNETIINVASEFTLIPNDARSFSITDSPSYWDPFDAGDTMKNYLINKQEPVSTISYSAILSYKAGNKYIRDTVKLADLEYYKENDEEPILKNRFLSKQVLFPR